MITSMIKVIMCHMVGDYFMQVVGIKSDVDKPIDRISCVCAIGESHVDE